MTDDTDAANETDDGCRSRDAAASPETAARVAREFTEAGRPFARVTVVRRKPPASAHTGDRAVLTADGELLGCSHVCGLGCRDAFVDDSARFLERVEA